MIRGIKQFIFITLLVYAGYFLLFNHIIYFGDLSFKVLKKSRPTSDYSFINTQNKRIKDILKIDELRKDGIGDLFVEMGKLKKEEKEKFEYLIKNSP